MRSRREEEARRRREERENAVAEKERRVRERERLRRTMGKAKGFVGSRGRAGGAASGGARGGRAEKPEGKRKLGRESVVLLEKVKKLMGKV